MINNSMRDVISKNGPEIKGKRKILKRGTLDSGILKRTFMNADFPDFEPEICVLDPIQLMLVNFVRCGFPIFS